MMHPKNKYDRTIKGKNKSINRTVLYTGEQQKKQAIKHRNTTKLCSCAMCGNPRKHFGEKTLQERIFYEKIDIQDMG